MTSYYVYYRVDASRAAAVQEAVRGLLRDMESITGVRGRLMRRRDDPSPGMEVYEDVGDEQGFEAALAQRAAPLGLERHVERFTCA